jgi:hypothetical protein
MCILLGVLFLLFGCGVFVSDAEVLSAIERAGYTKPTIISKHEFAPGFHGCGGDDVAAYDIEATNAQHKKVTFLACAGWPFKNVTIRF